MPNDSLSEQVKDAVKEALREQKAKEDWERTVREASPEWRSWYFGYDPADNNGLGSR